MARRRFFVSEVRQGRAVLRGDESHHLTRVLRVQAGQRYEISDNRSVYLAEIETARKDEVSFRVLEELAPDPPRVPVTLLTSLIRFERFEWMLEKATELGVDTVVPVQAERSEKGLEQAAARRLERWRRIVRESSQQARRVRLPAVEPPVPFSEAVSHSAPVRLFLEEQPGVPPLARWPGLQASASADIALLVGPEGGWSDRERQAARAAGWTPVSLGPRILRAETAALAALALIQCAR